MDHSTTRTPTFQELHRLMCGQIDSNEMEPDVEIALSKVACSHLSAQADTRLLFQQGSSKDNAMIRSKFPPRLQMA